MEVRKGFTSPDTWGLFPWNTQPPDFRIGLLPDLVSQSEINWAPLSTQGLTLSFTSLRRALEAQQPGNFLPLFLDHPGLTIRKDLLAASGLMNTEILTSLPVLETALVKLRDQGYIPVLASGGPGDIWELVSLVALSLGGAEEYQALQKTLKESPEGAGIPDNPLLNRTLEKLKAWRMEKILDSNWLDLTPADLLTRAEAGQGIVIVMPLSEHRTWPERVLRRYNRSPFPPQEPKNLGESLLVDIWAAGVPASGVHQEKARISAAKVLEESFQKDVVQNLLLAPVNSAAETLDGQATQVRFWAASHRNLFPLLKKNPPAADPMTRQLRERL